MIYFLGGGFGMFNEEFDRNGFIETMMNRILNRDSVPIVLKQEEIDKLKNSGLSYKDLIELNHDLDDGKCVICLDEYNSGDKDEKKFILLPCKHIFHKDCILEYLKNYNYKCPICRKDCGEHFAKI